MLKHFLTILAAAAVLFGAAATTNNSKRNYNEIASRAERFFNYQEWASAGALYSIMLAEKPDVVDTYGHAIVAAGMLADTAKQADLTNFAMESHIPIDSLFMSVEKTSFSIGQTSLYEQYLLYTKSHTQWLTRIVDAHLMRYYTYRRDPQGMIEYSKKILAGNPNNLQFLYSLAQGYLHNNQTPEAIDTYLRILEVNPSELEALLYLANYYMTHAESDSNALDKAISYFSKAQEVSSTPYIDASLAKLIALKSKSSK